MDLVVGLKSESGLLVLTTLFSNGTWFAQSSTDQTSPTVLFGGDIMACDTNADGMDDLIYAI